MNKRFIIAVVAVTLVASPILTGVHADAGGFTPLQANAAWNYGTYRVEKLAFSEGAVGPFTLGNAVFVAEPTLEAGTYNLTLIKDGKGKIIPNVPASAFTEKRFAMNGDRLVFARATSDARLFYDVVEASTVTGEQKVLAKDVFVNNAKAVSVVVDGSKMFFEFEYGNPVRGQAYRQQAVYRWDPEESKALPITQHWDLNRETIEDVLFGYVLVKMTFPTGYKELWLMHGYDVDDRRGEMEAYPGTWTIPSEDIVAAHFRNDKTVEYFRNFTRTTYDFYDGFPVAHAGETITWYRDVNAAYQTDDRRTVWIDEKDGLHLSDVSGASRTLGTAAYGRFHLENEVLYFATDHGGKMYVVSTKETKELPVGVTDVSGTKAIGINGGNEVAYLDLMTGVAHDVGTGSDAVIDADGRGYWRGDTGGIFSVTFIGRSAPKPAASAPSSKDASGHFVRGSLVKFVGKPTVFVVGTDRRLNSIPDEATAQNLFGSDWNTRIYEVTDIQMIDYPLGGVVNTLNDLEKI